MLDDWPNDFPIPKISFANLKIRLKAAMREISWGCLAGETDLAR